VAGLEVQTADGRWVGVPPDQGDGLVVNAGDLIQVGSWPLHDIGNININIVC